MTTAGSSRLRITIATGIVLAAMLAALGRYGFSHRSAHDRVDRELREKLSIGTKKEQVLSYVHSRGWEAYEDASPKLVVRYRGAAQSFVCKTNVLIVFTFDESGKLQSFRSEDQFICL
jgi:hypothetical protein